MNPSHHEPGNNVVSRNRLGRSGRFPIIVISLERVPPCSKRSQERVPEQDFFGNIGHVSEHVGCIASHAGGVIESSGARQGRWRAECVELALVDSLSLHWLTKRLRHTFRRSLRRISSDSTTCAPEVKTVDPQCHSLPKSSDTPPRPNAQPIVSRCLIEVDVRVQLFDKWRCSAVICWN